MNTKLQNRALQVLRKRVQYKGAHLQLPGTVGLSSDDTPAIREATRLYVASWILPLINALEAGDTRLLHVLIDRETGEPAPQDEPSWSAPKDN